jgi:hypothetical protein
MNWNSAKSEVIQVVRRGFPELRHDFVELRELGPWTRFAFLVTSPFSARIYASREIIEASPDLTVRGLLAHELVHVVQFKPLNLPQKLWLLLGYVLSSTRRAELEKAADIGAVERGFGEALLAAKAFGRKSYPTRADYAPFYLTETEIQAMLGPKGQEPRGEAFSRIMQSPVANAKESTGTLAVTAQAMDFRERKLYHQIHPLKLATDIGVTPISLYLLWQRRIAPAIVVGFVPPVVVSVVMMIWPPDLERLKRTALGQYISKYMTPTNRGGAPPDPRSDGLGSMDPQRLVDISRASDSWVGLVLWPDRSTP